MGHTVIAVDRDPQQIRDYVIGRLDGGALRAFEDRLCRDADLVREVEQFTVMREGLATLRDRGLLPIPDSPDGRRPTWRAAIAAMVLLGIAVALLLSDQMKPDVLLARRPGSSAVSAQVSLLAIRGDLATTIPSISSGFVEIRILPMQGRASSTYQVTLDRIGGEPERRTVATVGELRKEPDGFVHCYVRAKHLKPGGYELELRSTAGSEIRRASYPVTVTGPSPEPSSRPR